MAKKNPQTFMKRLKERTTKEKAAAKMARRQGKAERPMGREQPTNDPANDQTSS